MTKLPNTHISETEKVYCVIMTSFLTKTLEILHKDLSYDCICLLDTLIFGQTWQAYFVYRTGLSILVEAYFLQRVDSLPRYRTFDPYSHLTNDLMRHG